MISELRWIVATAAEHEALGRGDAPPGVLSPAEQAALAAMRFPARRRKWLLGRWAAKRVLGAALRERGIDVPADRITVANDPSGAPYAELDGDRLPWTLSLSRRAEQAFAALSPADAPPIGVDLELVVPRDRALVRGFFTAAEADEVARRAGRDEHLAVARIWSAKESVLKAMKLGLRLDTRRVSVRQLDAATVGGWRALDIAVRPEAGGVLAFDGAWRDEGRYVLTVAAPRGPVAPAALPVTYGVGIDITTGR